MSQLSDTVRSARVESITPDVIVFPTDRRYDDARRAWNLAVDQRPPVVALPRTVNDVVGIVDYAREMGLKLAVQGTGHGAAARGPLDGTILVNMSGLTGVEIDPQARVARVKAGTIWLDVVTAAVEHGLTALHGSAQDVGVVGYTLGGGIGWLARMHGLSSSSVLAAEVVTAEGEVVRADAESSPDLFWALRGGGGSFGIVTELEIALYPVTEAYAGWLVWPATRAAEVLAAWAEWTTTAPDEVTSVGRILQIPPVPEMPEHLRGRQLVIVEAAYLGDAQSGRELLRPLLALEPETDTFATIPALDLTLLHQDPPHPVPGVGHGWLLSEFDAVAAAAVVRSAAMDGTSPLLSVEVRHLDGKLGRPDPNGGALSHLEAPYVLYAVGAPMGPVSVGAIEERIDDVAWALAPWDAQASFLNFAERRTDPRSFYPAGAYDRLREIRSLVDPEGLFRANHPIG